MSRPILVRSCLNLPGLKLGRYATVDADDPYIAALLRSGFLHADENPDDEAPAAGSPPLGEPPSDGEPAASDEA